MKLQVSSSSGEYASAEEMLIDEAGIDLFINGEIELGASFESLDSFQLAYAVLPEDFELDMLGAEDLAEQLQAGPEGQESEDALETMIWVASQELAKRRGYAKK